jgi:hypothetical protein
MIFLLFSNSSLFNVGIIEVLGTASSMSLTATGGGVIAAGILNRVKWQEVQTILCRYGGNYFCETVDEKWGSGKRLTI